MSSDLASLEVSLSLLEQQLYRAEYKYPTLAVIEFRKKIMKAIEYNNEKDVRLLIEDIKRRKLSVSEVLNGDAGFQRYTPLITAIIQKNKKLIDLLIESGAKVWVPDGHGHRYPIDFLIYEELPTQWIEEFIKLSEQGADVLPFYPGDTKKSTSFAAFLVAVRETKFKYADYFLNKYPEFIDYRFKDEAYPSNDQDTLLHKYVLTPRPDVVEYLLSKKKDLVFTKNRLGYLPLNFIVLWKSDFVDVQKKNDYTKYKDAIITTAQLLIDAMRSDNESLNNTPNEWQAHTPLWYAKENKLDKVAEMLEKAGAKAL